MKLQYVLYAVIVATVALAGCKGEDTTAPSVVITEPSEGDTMVTGNTMAVIVDFKDDRELLNYTAIVRIATPTLAGNVMEPLEYGDTDALFGDEITDTHQVEIPLERAAGEYELEITATDMNANNSAKKTRHIILMNGEDQQHPQFSVSNLSDTQNNAFPAGSDIPVNGNAQDNRDLGGMRVQLRDLNNELVDVYEFQMQTTATNFNHAIPGPSSGTYNMLITVADNANNQVERSYTIQMQ